MKKFLKRRDVCPLCGSQQISTLYSVDYQSPDIKGYLTAFYTQQGIIEHEYLEGANYILCECDECGFLFQQEIPGEELSERIYEHWISPQIALEQELHKLDLKQFRYFTNDLLKVVHSFQKPMREIAVLDFGMGWGTTLQILKSMGCRVYGLEISESRIAYAAANGITVLSWDQMKAMQFDYIHTYQVFEHLENPRETFSELLGCLRPGGYIRIAVPNGSNIRKIVKQLRWQTENLHSANHRAIDPLEHINCFTYRTLKYLGETNGCKVVQLPSPLLHTNLYQVLQGMLRTPYRFMKYGDLGRVPDILFQKPT